MTVISARQILILHEHLIEKYGGSSGIRDTNMFLSAIHRPFATYDDQDLYPSIFDKAAALIQSITKNHPFVDGNKRTAFASAYILLETNGHIINATEKKVVNFMLRVANENLSVDEISSWLKSHSVPHQQI